MIDAGRPCWRCDSLPWAASPTLQGCRETVWAAVCRAEKPSIESRIAAVTGAAASDLKFLREAREYPSGLAAFDAAYQVVALPRQIGQPLVDAGFAASILQWPTDAIAPHSVLAWRDRFALHLQL